METLTPVSACRHTTSIRLTTTQPTEFIDLTDRLQRLVADAGLRFGILNVQTLHTTTAIVVNEHEPLLLADFQSLLEAAAPDDGRYRHDDTTARTVNLTDARAAQRACALSRAAAAAFGLPERDGRPAAAGTLAACVLRRAGRPARARDFGAHLRGGRAMKVKMILPALTEATGPFWRPIKYSLFPPLGLATLAAYLGDDCDVEIQDEHVEPLDLNDAPDLVVIQVYITSANRAYRHRRSLPAPRRVRRAWRTARDVAAGRSRRARRHDLPRPRRGHVAAVPGRFQARLREARVSIARCGRWPAFRRFGAI